MADLLSVLDLDRSDVEDLMEHARRLAGSDLGVASTQRPAIVGLMFFQDSLRTRLGFTAAAARLGATTLEVTAGKGGPRMSMTESDLDAARCVGDWCDIVCVRHEDPAFSRLLADHLQAPVINCGNGDDEHPTQALVDLAAIAERCGRIDGARIAIVGDLHTMRCAHSLILALTLYDHVTVRAIAPPDVELPESLLPKLQHTSLRLELSDVLDLDDIELVYVAGLPANRSVETMSDELRSSYAITAERLDRYPGVHTVLCPLPRVDEINEDVDARPQGYYFAQNAAAIHVREAVLRRVLAAGA